MKREYDNSDTRTFISFSKYVVTTLFFLSVFQIRGFSQCAENLTFNYNNLSYWSLYLGTYNGARATNPINSSFNTPPATITSMQSLNEASSTEKAITIFRNQGAAQSTDPIATAIKTVPNINGYQYDYSIKLGSSLTGKRLRKMAYRVNVPSGSQAYTITYAYALVLQDPGHAWDQQPRFTATVRDPSKPVGQDTIKCASVQYFVPADATTRTNQGFVLVSSGLYYKNWAEASVDIAGYAGKTIIIEFESEGCSQSGHYGYAYFALRNDGCSEGSIAGETNICNTGSFTYSTPPIVDASYTWTLPSGWTGSSTSNSITVTPNNNSGYITVTPSQSCGSVQTRSLYVKSQTEVPIAPGAISGPTSICNNSTNITYSISPVANATSYAWTIPSGWSVVSGGTSTSITVNAGAGSGSISVVAKNGCGTSSPSSTPLNIIASTPSAGGTITTNPNTSVCAGTSVTLTNSGKTGSILAWQRSYNGGQDWSDIAGQTGTTYTESNPTQSALYRVRVQNGSCLEAVSAEATLAVNALPNIDFHPSNVGICTGASASFTVSASGAGLTYQWQRSTNGSTWTNITAATTPSDGVTYSNFTTATLTISSAVVGVNNYQYRCLVSGTCSPAATSNAAVLTVSGAAVSIGAQPTAASICQGSTVNLSMAATGTNLTYQWYSNTTNSNTGGTAISGATTNSYSFNASTAGTNYYYVVATSTCSPTVLTATTNAVSVVTTASSTVSVSMAASPIGTLCAGTSVTFTATPTNGGSSPTYAWTKNGTTISGETAATYTTTTLVNGDIIGVSLTSDKSCVIGNPASAAPVTMSVTASPAAPTGTGASRVGEGALVLSATPVAGSTVDWYAVATGGSVLTGGQGVTSYTTPSLNNTTTYYAAARNIGNGCSSPIRTAVVATVNLNVDPTITLADITKNYGDNAFTVSANSNSSGVVTYTSSNTNVATISGSTITIVGAGNTTITASQASSGNFNAKSVTATLVVNKINPTISLGNMTKTYGDASFNLNTTSNSTGAITYSSSNTSVATISGSTVTIVGAGSATITASQVADANYNAGTTTASLTVGKASPTMSLGNMIKTYGNASFNLNGTSNSTGAITYSSSNTSVATISGNTVTIVGAGSATITASQVTDANYNAGTTTASLTVGKASPTISLGNMTKTYGDASFSLSATSNSTGAITYSSSNTSVATISGNTVTIVGAGSATITASQVADANYNAGTTSASLTVGKASPTISLGNMTKTYGNAPFSVGATSNSTGAITYSSSNTSVATISGNTVTIVGAGSATITASQVADANYNAGTTTASLTVGKASPTISLGNMTKTYGDASFSLNATSNSTGAITYSSNNTSVATISGSTVTIVGAGSATITASQQETSDYLASQVSATITIAKQKASIAIEDISKNYGDPDVELKASSASMGSYSFVSSNTSVARIVGTTLSIVGAGQAVITVQQVETENYASNSKDIKLNVAKAPLSLVADNKVKCNNSPNPVFTFTATGFVRNDDVTAISRKPEYKLISASSAEDAYIIRPFAAEAKDYVISYGDGMLTEHTINPVRVEPDYAKVAKGTNVTIRAFGNSVAYQWNAVPGILTSLNGDRIVARVFAKTAYSVTMTDPNGCKTTGSYEVDVNEDITIAPAIVLSPNGDGRNDKFVIDNIDLYPENKLQVFDRTGKMLYEAVNYRNNWDGRVNGALLVKDNYFYVLTVKGQVVKRGSITVVR
ncbi:MAG: gliding motility-associated C-terminal domain-containing protein [Chitinophagales bacterium]|nr:gliding motility-associated C-terminal domain-containing protein [Chitinophagales bacterium]